MLPEAFILTDPVTIIADNDRYQYRLTYSIFGEILKVELPFLKLPPNAQRLTKGKDTENYLLALENHKNLLRFQLPLGISEFWKTDEFFHISQSIDKRESELGDKLPETFLPFVSDPWLKEFYLKIKEDIEQKGTGDFWRGLAGLMSHDAATLESSFRYLRAYSWQLPAAIIGAIWPLLKSRPVLRHFYENAHLYPSEDTKNWLLKVLPSEKSTFFRGLILKGLSVYVEDTVYQSLILHFNTEKEMGEGESEILVAALGLYQTEEVLSILWKFLVSKNYFAAKAAHNALIARGISEEKIAERLTAIFTNDQYTDRTNSLLSRFQQLENSELLLTSEQFLTRAAYAVKKNRTIRPQTNLASLLDRTWEFSTYRMIVDFLYNPDPMVRRLGLDQISGLLIQFPNRIKEINQDTIKRIFHLTNDVIKEVSIEAIETIRVLVPRYGKLSWIVGLLSIRNRSELLTHLLPALLALHRKGFKNLAVVPFCIRNLKHKTVDIKKNSILILQYYRLPEVENGLNNIQNDPDPVLREALGRGWRGDDDFIKVLR